MAKITSPLINQASGSLGGTTFQASNGRLRMQVRSRPRQNVGGLASIYYGVFQSRPAAQRYEWQYLTQRWPTLTDAQRAGWAALGAQQVTRSLFGSRSPLTGLQVYLRYNISIGFYAGGSVDDPPPPPQPTPPVIVTGSNYNIDPTGGFADMLVFLESIPDNTPMYFYGAGPFSAGRSTINPSELYLLVQGPTYGGSFISFWTPGDFGFPASYGGSYFVGLRAVDPNNWLGPMTIARTLVAPSP